MAPELRPSAARLRPLSASATSVPCARCGCTRGGLLRCKKLTRMPHVQETVEGGYYKTVTELVEHVHVAHRRNTSHVVRSYARGGGTLVLLATTPSCEPFHDAASRRARFACAWQPPARSVRPNWTSRSPSMLTCVTAWSPRKFAPAANLVRAPAAAQDVHAEGTARPMSTGDVHIGRPRIRPSRQPSQSVPVARHRPEMPVRPPAAPAVQPATTVRPPHPMHVWSQLMRLSLFVCAARN